MTLLESLGTPFLEYVTNLGLIYSLKLESAFQIYVIIGLIIILNVKAPFACVVLKMKHGFFFFYAACIMQLNVVHFLAKYQTIGLDVSVFPDEHLHYILVCMEAAFKTLFLMD